MSFESASTTEQGVLADFASYAVRNLQDMDRLPASMGTNKPLFDKPPAAASDVLDLIDGGFRQQRGMQGGFASDTPMTDAGSGYEARRRDFIRSQEGVRQVAYPDGAFPSVGVGFNMSDAPDRRMIWARAFGTGSDAPDYDAVRAGKQALSHTQIDRLFDATIPEYERVVNRTFAGVDLKEHQRLALVSVAYNGPALLGPLAEPARRGDMAAVGNLIANGIDSNPRRAARRRLESQVFAGVQ